MRKVVVIGSLNIDLVFNVKKLPQPGVTIFSHAFEYHFGGKGANQSYTIGKLGGDVELLGVVGNDDYGVQILNHLKQSANVKVDHIKVNSKLPTGIANIIVDEQGNNQIIVHSGANFDFDNDYIEKIKKIIDTKDIIILQLEIPLNVVEELINYAYEQHKIIILNPASVQQLSDTILAKIDYLIPNETELEVLMNQKFVSLPQFLQAAEHFANEKHLKNLIVTLGSQGSYLISKQKTQFIDIYKVVSVDSTSAGDSYLGAFVVKFSQKASLVETLDYAAKVSAIVVTKSGAQASISSHDEVEKTKLVK